MTVHLNRPSTFTWAHEMRCRRCRQDTPHVVTSYVWYGPITTCCECGAVVIDGELRRKRKSDVYAAIRAAALWPTLPRHTEWSRWLTEAVNRPEGDL